MCAGLFISVLPMEIQLSRGEGCNPITGLTPQYACAYRQSGPEFPVGNVVFFSIH